MKNLDIKVCQGFITKAYMGKNQGFIIEIDSTGIGGDKTPIDELPSDQNKEHPPFYIYPEELGMNNFFKEGLTWKEAISGLSKGYKVRLLYIITKGCRRVLGIAYV